MINAKDGRDIVRARANNGTVNGGDNADDVKGQLGNDTLNGGLGDRAALAVGWPAWADHRKVINGILWKVRTGAPWRDLPERYGPWQTCYDRFVRWRRDGTWERLLSRVQAKSDMVSDVLVEVSLDSTVVRAHQHAAGARCLPSRVDAKREHHIRRTKRSDVVGAP